MAQQRSSKIDRRKFLLAGAATGAALGLGNTATATPAPAAPSQPNIILFLSDQFRWDFLGANQLNGSAHTPNLDALANSGTLFTHAVTNQPVCAPARSVLFTSRFATETGVWRNGLPLSQTLPTLAGELRKSGYTSNLIGKWHLAPHTIAEGGGPGFVRPEYRGGFLDLWEGANELEHTSHPYYGSIWDGDGHEITYKDEYRVDFITDRTERFLRQKHTKPFFLFVSQLEPHQQNDMQNRIIGPNGSAERFANSYVPPDLRNLPGNWQQELPDYYGAVESIDNSVGRIMKTLDEQGLASNTIFVFISDHGCHFETRNKEYKRSVHNASSRIPLIIHGPGFETPQRINQMCGIIDIAPTLLEIAGASAPSSMKGHSLVPLIRDQKARAAWPNQQLLQISESMTGRAIRTPDWTYCIAEITGTTNQPASPVYQEYQMYDQRNDPYEQTNLAGRKEFRKQADELREQLKKLLTYAGEPEPEIRPAKLYP
ncbi:sulfatase [Edaphobacter acidisoli]|uniref:Sulfatase n=1 Tax=Edaphobacter acidisoli TaxID=2040573 RepID=A0A916RLK7_9BACT|nr:sulfatase-like hydrolase/transferase [Edaphobacter acidisoli]GGA60680.1 sulfatase [Edaphobacter acidisoli]